MMRNIVILLAILFSAGQAMAESESGKCGENLTWSFQEVTGTLTISGEGAMNDYSKRATFYSSHEFGSAPWYKYISYIDNLVIEYGVTNIGRCAFYELKRITSVMIPESVTFIGEDAFLDCKMLESVSLPKSLTTIDQDAFRGCYNLTTVNIPEGVTGIGVGAFYSCNQLAHINIPTTLTSIGNSAFDGTKWLIEKEDGVVYLGNWAYKWKGTMPENTPVKLRDGCKGIADYAFCNLPNLVWVDIPEGVVYIGESAFGYCSSLATASVPYSVKFFGDRSFVNCSALTAIHIPEGVTSIDRDTFKGCTELTFISFPSTLTTIAKGAFDDTAWYKNQPDGLVYIGEGAYKWKGSMPENTSVKLSDNCKWVNESAFSGCTNLTSVTIPEGVTTIKSGAFYNCGLTEVVVPKSVTNILGSAFNGCNSLYTVYLLAPSLESYGNSVFGTATRKIYVPENSVKTYKENWNKYSKYIAAIPKGSGDVDGNGVADFSDAAQIAGDICSSPAPQYSPTADLNADGVVNAADIVLLVSKIK